MNTLLQALKRKCRRLAALLFLVISSLIPWRWLPSSNAVADAFKRGCRLVDRVESAVVLKLYTLLRGIALDRGLIGRSGAVDVRSCAPCGAAGWRHERNMLQEVMGWAAQNLEHHAMFRPSMDKVIKVLRDGSGSARAGQIAMNEASGLPAGHDRQHAGSARPGHLVEISDPRRGAIA